MKPPYKNPTGQWYTRQIVYEEWYSLMQELRSLDKPIFTLHIQRPGYVCIRNTFVAMGDPTGYKWAIKYLGDYEHWKTLMKCKWFQEAYEVWINELETKIRSEALDIIRGIASEGLPAQSLVAAKYLASFEWKKGERGRPSKAELQGELKRAAQALTVEDDDAERIGLKLKVVK